MADFLEGFSERMEMVGIVESIVNRKGKNLEIEKWFGEHELTNLVFSVLLKIMDKTLTEDKECSSEDIRKFLTSVLPHYRLVLSGEQLESLTHYILKSILQNDGQAYYFQTMDYEADKKIGFPVRLIADRLHEQDGHFHITYSLTDQGFDFLFRTKEVDQEIKMTIEELKLKEFIKRKNFRKAQGQSQELIRMIRQQKQKIEYFIIKIKENIHDVDIDDFENLMDSTYELLEDEYNLLSEIMKMVRSSEEMIRQGYEVNFELDESLKKAQIEIKQINFNIKSALSEQKGLILNRQTLSNLYIDTIGESFQYGLEKRFDLVETILKPMERQVGRVEQFWKLVNPIFLPNPNKHTNLSSFYAPQRLFNLNEEPQVDMIETEELAEDKEQEKIERLNRTYVEIIEFLLEAVSGDEQEITLEKLLPMLDKAHIDRFMENHLFFTTLLKLYDIGIIDIEAWREQQDRTFMNLSEEFNLDYCLEELDVHDGRFQQLVSIELAKIPGEKIDYEVSRNSEEGLEWVEKIEITNFKVRAVVRNGKHENSNTDFQSPIGEWTAGS